MSNEMQQYAIDMAIEAFDLDKDENYIAEFIKTKFDIKYDENWQCIVGLSFQGSITHHRNEFIYFGIGEYNIALFRKQ